MVIMVMIMVMIVLPFFSMRFLPFFRSSASTDSGLLLKSSSSPDSLPPFLRRHHNKLKKQLASTMSSNNATVHVCRPRPRQQHQQEVSLMSRHFSLHSLLEALPAASVDTGALDGRVKRASLSSLSTNSRTSDFDGYFYIWTFRQIHTLQLMILMEKYIYIIANLNGDTTVKVINSIYIWRFKHQNCIKH